MPRYSWFVGSLTLSLGEVSSVRQNINTASAAHAVQSIGELLQERNIESEEVMHQLAVTPGAATSFGNSLKVVAQNIETQIEKKITDGQAATQGKLDSLFEGLKAANIAANTGKTTASGKDKSWFECVADEQAKRQAAEAADKSLTDSRSNEEEACQLQQDNKGFKFDAADKYKLEFECDHSKAGNCADQLKKWQESVLQKMFADAEAALKKDEADYTALKTDCDAKEVVRIKAQSSLGSAELAWGTQRAACGTLAPQRLASMCDFGTKAQAKCSAEAEYAKLVAATKQAKGDAHSEVDRESEWLASRTTQCMIAKSMQKGLDGAVAGADLDACVAQVNFAKDVGKLNTKQAEFVTLSKTNACVDGLITFFNGQTWSIPAGDKPSSTSYTRGQFKPQLDPTSGNFDFCSGAPAPALPPPAGP